MNSTELLIAAVAAAGATAGLTLVLNHERKKLALPFEPDEMHWAKTADGWELPMGRYLPRGPRAVKEPVILCHGMGANRYNLDLNERYSVARYLAARGFECFVTELRGSGITRKEGRGRRYGFNFDDYIREDIPAMVAKAKAVANAERVLWVGHSKGGMVMYAWCGSGDRAHDVAGVVAIGSPAGFPHFTGAFKTLLGGGHRVILQDALYTEPFLRILAPLGGRGLVRIRYMASHANIEPQVTAWAMANLLGNISTAVLRQFALWIRTGNFTSADGAIDYRAGLSKSDVPFLLVAGSVDELVAPAAVELARDSMTRAKENGLVDYFVAGKATGFQADYGHGDLVLGRHAPDEIFPRIEAWLRAHGTRAD